MSYRRGYRHRQPRCLRGVLPKLTMCTRSPLDEGSFLNVAGALCAIQVYFALPYLANVWLPDADGSDDTYTAHWSSSVTDILIDSGAISGRRLLASSDRANEEGEKAGEISSDRANEEGETEDEITELRRVVQEQRKVIDRLGVRLEQLEKRLPVQE